MDRLTIPEYLIMMEAANLRAVDEDFRVHQQAFLNFAVQAEKKVGKNKKRPVYVKFEKFFDYKERVRAVTGKKQPDPYAAVKKFMREGGGRNA